MFSSLLSFCPKTLIVIFAFSYLFIPLFFFFFSWPYSCEASLLLFHFSSFFYFNLIILFSLFIYCCILLSLYLFIFGFNFCVFLLCIYIIYFKRFRWTLQKGSPPKEKDYGLMKIMFYITWVHRSKRWWCHHHANHIKGRPSVPHKKHGAHM